jgi:hypothetical protein
MKKQLFISFTIFVSLYCHFHAVRLAAGENNCMPSLISSSANPLSYRERGGRCEGLYEKPKSGTLYLVSFAQPASDVLQNPPENLTLRWGRLNDKPVHLSAYALNYPYSDSYQMDKIMNENSGHYDWPLSFIHALDISAEDLGVVCRTTVVIGNLEKELYYPIRLSPKVSKIYRMIFKSDYALFNITYSLALLDRKNGFPTRIVRQSEKVATFRAPGDLIKIDIDVKMPTGCYELKIKATYGADNLPTGQTAWFFLD